MTELSGLVACVGLGFGDEGKGKVVDALARLTGSRIVIRFGGGPQAAHHVVTPEGRVHCFAQFPAGMLVPGTKGWIAREMLIDPLALAREAEALALAGAPDGRARLRVDPGCRVVTPYHRLVGRMREIARGAERHGSCGRGVGEAVRDAAGRGPEAILAGDLLDPSLLAWKLRQLRAVALDYAEQLAAEGAAGDAGAELDRQLEAVRRLGGDGGSGRPGLTELAASMADGLAGVRLAGETELAAAVEEELGRGVPVLLEGAHGVLLDARRGFVPHVTATDTTFAPAESLAARIAPGLPLFRLGITRAYATRHGAGPFVTGDAGLTEALPEPHNVPNPWQGPMRVGPLDLVALRYSISVAAQGPVSLAVTHLDRLSGLGKVRAAVSYELDLEPRNPTPDARLLERCRPVYGELPGWAGDLSSCRTHGDLPPRVRDFLRFLESPEGLGAPVFLASVGPSAAESILVGEG